MPKIKFIQTTETEVERIIYTSQYTGSGFYIEKGFHVLPYRIDGDTRTVCLPNIGFEKVLHYWTKVAKLGYDFPLVIPKEFQDEVKEIAEDIIHLHPEKVSRLESDWKEVEQKFWEVVEVVMPAAKGMISYIEVRPTSYGTVASFNTMNSRTQKPLVCYVREDFGIEHIAEAILSALAYSQLNKTFFTWSEIEAFTDYLMLESGLKDLFPHYEPTLFNLMKKDERLQEESRMYLESIDVQYAQLKAHKKPLSIKDELLYLNEHCIETKLTPSQCKILRLLLANGSKITSPFELGDILFSNTEEYSLWAVNKAVQRLREKLVELGADPFVLTTHRGRGYSL